MSGIVGLVDIADRRGSVRRHQHPVQPASSCSIATALLADKASPSPTTPSEVRPFSTHSRSVQLNTLLGPVFATAN